MISFSWQQAGAFIYTGQNVDFNRLARAAGSGIRWVAPVLYNDDAAAPFNMGNLGNLKVQANSLGMNVGGWFNGLGGDPDLDAGNIAGIVKGQGLAFIVLDLEAYYQFPGGTPEKMPKMIARLRSYFPVGSKAIAVTTNGFNDSMIWNGRTGSAPSDSDRSFRDYNIHVLPQWYLKGDPWSDPVRNMQYLEQEGMKDNFLDPGYLDRRGVLQAAVHGVVEATGVEGNSLSKQLDAMRLAKAHGYVKGFSVYTLEHVSDADFALIKAATDLRI